MQNPEMSPSCFALTHGGLSLDPHYRELTIGRAVAAPARPAAMATTSTPVGLGNREETPPTDLGQASAKVGRHRRAPLGHPVGRLRL
jgi:hypothetical protein